MAFCLANAFTYSSIFKSQFCFYTKEIFKGFFGFFEQRSCNSQFPMQLYYAVTNCQGQLQSYETSWRNLMHFLINQTRVVAWERVGSSSRFSLDYYHGHAIWILSCNVTYYSSCFFMKVVPSCSNNLKSLKVAAYFIFSIKK